MISFCAWCSLFPPLLSASMKTLKQMIHLQVGHHDLKTDDALKQGTSIYVACQCDCQHHMPVKCSQKFRVPGRVVYASSAACAAAAATVSKFRVSRVGCCYTLAHESVAFRVVVGLSGRFRMGWGRASGPGPGILPTWSEGPNLVRRSGLGVASYTWTCRVGAMSTEQTEQFSTADCEIFNTMSISSEATFSDLKIAYSKQPTEVRKALRASGGSTGISTEPNNLIRLLKEFLLDPDIQAEWNLTSPSKINDWNHNFF